jgi:hypothetical protein
MLQLDYALLCDYVRGEGSVAHVIAAGIDTIYRPEVPTVANFGLLAHFTFTDEDLGQEHRLELQLADQEGQQVARITGTPPLQPVPGLPEGWPTRRARNHLDQGHHGWADPRGLCDIADKNYVVTVAWK